MVSADALAVGVLPNTVAWIPLRKIRTDHDVNTRLIDFNWVEKRVADFDPDKLGVPTVSEREDGTFVWLDGQNRGELCRRAGWGDQSIECRVFKGLTKGQEAALFLGLNDNRRVSAFSRFAARITAGDPDAVAINRIVTESGWEISDQPGDRKIGAVVSLERIWHGAPQDDTGYRGATLKLTLRLIAEAWGFGQDGVNGNVLLGLGLVCNRYGTSLDVTSLVKRLSSYRGKAPGVLGDARGLKAFRGGTLAMCVAEVVVESYNKRRHTGALPEWRAERGSD